MIPWCLATSGSVRARQIAQSAWRASDVHTFWPVRPASPRSVATRPGAQRGQVGTGLGLAEQLAPGDLAAPRRAEEAFLLGRGAVLRWRGRPRRRSPGRLRLRPRRWRGRGRGRAGQGGGAGQPGAGAAEELAQREGPAQVQVGVVFPGEADPAEHLDAVLGVVHRGVQRQRGGGRGGQRVPRSGVLVRGPGGVPGQGGGAFGPAGHGGAEVLDRLEGADRAAELAADPGVARRPCRRTRRPRRRPRPRTGSPPGRGPGRWSGRGTGPGRDDHVVEATVARSREKSTGVSSVTVTPGWSWPSRNQASPSAAAAGASRCRSGPQQRAVSPLTRSAPSGSRVASRVPGVSATVARGSRRTAASSAGRTGPGVRARASSSRAAASVGQPCRRGGDGAGGRGRPGRVGIAPTAPSRTGVTATAGPLGPVAERRLQGLLLLRHRDRHDSPPTRCQN